MTSPTNDPELAEYAAAQQREYGKWMAADVIMAGNAPAYNPGDPVPISNVDRHEYARNGQVLLQHAYIADNPDDEDVKTFLGYAKANPEHPAVMAWQEYRDQQAEQAKAAKQAAPPLIFGGDAEKASGKPAKASTGSTTTKGE